MARLAHGPVRKQDPTARFYPSRLTGPGRARVRFEEFHVRTHDEIVRMECPRCHDKRPFRLATVVRQVMKLPPGERWNVTTFV